MVTLVPASGTASWAGRRGSPTSSSVDAESAGCEPPLLGLALLPGEPPRRPLPRAPSQRVSNYLVGVEEHHVALLILEADASPDVRFRHLVSFPVRQMSYSVSWRQRPAVEVLRSRERRIAQGVPLMIFLHFSLDSSGRLTRGEAVR